MMNFPETSSEKKSTSTNEFVPINGITERFKKLIEENLIKFYNESLELRNKEPSNLSAILTLVSRAIGVDLVANFAGNGVNALANNNKAANAVNYGIRAAAFICFYFKDKNDKEQLDAAKNFIKVIKKLGGIAKVANLAANYLNERFLYLLLALQEEEGENNYRILASFFGAVIVDIIYKKISYLEENAETNFFQALLFPDKSKKIENKLAEFLRILADDIIPLPESELYKDKVLRFLGINKTVNYRDKSVTLESMFADLGAISPDGKFLLKKAHTKYFFPPQYINNNKIIERLRYIICSNNFVETTRPDELMEYKDIKTILEYLKEGYSEILNDIKSNIKKGNISLVIYEFISSRKTLLKAITNKKSYFNELTTYSQYLFFLYYRLIFVEKIHYAFADSLNIENFLSTERKWLKECAGMEANKIPSIENILNLCHFLRSKDCKQEQQDYQVEIYKSIMHDYLRFLAKKIKDKPSREALYEFMEKFNLVANDEKDEKNLNEKILDFILQSFENYSNKSNKIVFKKLGNKLITEKELIEIQSSLIENIHNKNKLEKILSEIATDYLADEIERLLNSLINGKYLLEYVIASKDKNLTDEIIELLLKFGSDPCFVIYKIIYPEIPANKYNVKDKLKREIIPNVFELNTLHVYNFNIENYTGNDKEISVTKLERLCKLYKNNPIIFDLLERFVCYGNEYQRQLLNDNNNARISNDLNLLEKALLAPANIHGETILHYALANDIETFYKPLLIDLGALFRIKLTKTFYSRLNTKLWNYIEAINQHLFEWANIFVGKASLNNSVMKYYKEHQDYDSLYTILYSLNFPVGSNQETPLFRIIFSDNLTLLNTLSNIFEYLIKRQDAEKCIEILVNFLQRPFVTKEKASKQFLLLNPITLAAHLGNLAALKLFQRIITYQLIQKMERREADFTEGDHKLIRHRVAEFFLAQDSLGGSSLHYAVLSGQYETVYWLLGEIGVDSFIRVTLMPQYAKAILEQLNSKDTITNEATIDWLLTIETKKENGKAEASKEFNEGPIDSYTVLQYNQLNEVNSSKMEKLLSTHREQQLNYFGNKFEKASNDNEAFAWALKLISSDDKKAENYKKATRSPTNLIAENNFKRYFNIIINNSTKITRLHQENIFENIMDIDIEQFRTMLQKFYNTKFLQNKEAVTILMLVVAVCRYDLVALLMEHGAGEQLHHRSSAIYGHIIPFNNYYLNEDSAIGIKNSLIAKIIDVNNNKKAVKLVIAANKNAEDLSNDDPILQNLLRQHTDRHFFSVLRKFKILCDDIAKGVRPDFYKLWLDIDRLISAFKDDDYKIANSFIDAEGDTLLHIFLKVYKNIELHKFDWKNADFEKYFSLLENKLLSTAEKILSHGRKVLFKRNLAGLVLIDNLNTLSNSSVSQFILDIVVIAFKQENRDIGTKELSDITSFIASNAALLKNLSICDAKDHSLLEILARHGRWKEFDIVTTELELTKSELSWKIVDLQDKSGLSALHFLCCWPNQQERVKKLLDLKANPNIGTLAPYKISLQSCADQNKNESLLKTINLKNPLKESQDSIANTNAYLEVHQNFSIDTIFINKKIPVNDNSSTNNKVSKKEDKNTINWEISFTELCSDKQPLSQVKFVNSVPPSIYLPPQSTPLMIAAKLDNAAAVINLFMRADGLLKDESGHTAIYYAFTYPVARISALKVLPLLLCDIKNIRYFLDNQFFSERGNDVNLIRRYNNIKQSITKYLTLKLDIQECKDLATVANKYREKCLILFRKYIQMDNNNCRNKEDKEPISQSSKIETSYKKLIGSLGRSSMSREKTQVAFCAKLSNSADFNKIVSELYSNEEIRNKMLVPDEDGITPLQLLIYLPYEAAVFKKALLALEGMINDSDKNTLLLYAFAFQKYDKVKVLLELGVKVSLIVIYIAALQDHLSDAIQQTLKKNFDMTSVENPLVHSDELSTNENKIEEKEEMFNMKFN